MNIVLIGYRGTGKSEVGALLAARLGIRLVGMDAEIVREAGMSIPQIVERFGWPGFRDLETAEARKLSGQDHLVIDCGGGVIERPENVEILRRNARIVWLKASVATIVERIQGDTQRPALTAGKSFTEEVAEVLERRTPLYQAAAHFAVDTDPLTPAEVAEAILVFLKQGQAV
jgi:shikimate kinase